VRTICYASRGSEKRLIRFAESVSRSDVISERVRSIRERIRAEGMPAVLALSEEVEGVKLTPATLRVRDAELRTGLQALSSERRRAIREAMRSVRAFHRKSLPRKWAMRNAHGARVGEVFYPLREVGIYIPGGRVPLVSTVVMTAVLARMAGVRRIAVCTPPDSSGAVNPVLLGAFALCGVSEVYKLGGAVAVSTLAYGAGSIAPVDKIFGPGGAYLNEAKRQVFGEVGVDLLAGPSEVMIIADASTPPAYVAADLLAQAEHDVRSRVVFTAPDREYVGLVRAEIDRQLPELRHQDSIRAVLREGSLAVLVSGLEEAAAVANLLAPEHLEILLPPSSASRATKLITTAGAIFEGRETPTVLGDFASGPNHTLPTGRTARYLSGLRVADFFRRSSVVRYSRQSLARAARMVEAFSEMEQLDAHGRSLTIRLRD